MEAIIHANDFSNLLRCLSLLNCICANVDIKGGILRQKSDDEYSIIEMDLTSLVSDCDILIPDIKGKLPILKALSKQEIKISSSGSRISFSSVRSTLQFDNSHSNSPQHLFISSEELGKEFTLREEDAILEFSIKKETSTLIKVIASQFNLLGFQIFFEGNTASIIPTTTDRSQHFRIAHGIPIKAHMNCFSSVLARDLLIDHDGDILLRIYKVREPLCINQFNAFIGKVMVRVYGASKLNAQSKLDTSEP